MLAGQVGFFFLVSAAHSMDEKFSVDRPYVIWHGFQPGLQLTDGFFISKTNFTVEEFISQRIALKPPGFLSEQCEDMPNTTHTPWEWYSLLRLCLEGGWPPFPTPSTPYTTRPHRSATNRRTQGRTGQWMLAGYLTPTMHHPMTKHKGNQQTTPLNTTHTYTLHKKGNKKNKT